MSTARTLWGVGLSTIASDGTVLDAWYPELGLGAQEPDDAETAASTWGAFADDDERLEARALAGARERRALGRTVEGQR